MNLFKRLLGIKKADASAPFDAPAPQPSMTAVDLVKEPTNPTVRILLARTLLDMNKVTPTTVAGFRDEVMLLQLQFPLPEPVQGAVDRVLSDLFKA